MSWIDSLDVSIEEALRQFPDHVLVGTCQAAQQNYLVSLSSLRRMQQMGLEGLPLSTIALPYEMGDILLRPCSEKVVKDASHHLSDYFSNFFVAAIYELQSLFAAHEIQAFIIGGITRDMMLSAERRFEIQDVDIIIEGNAVEAAQQIAEASRNFDCLQTFESFGTAKLMYKKQIEMDFASTRQEIYRGCGLLPEIEALGVPLEEDMIRRDFTINALALSIAVPGKVIDCTSGFKDLEARKIRLLKPESFFEDPSRIIRALKFAVRLDFTWGDELTYLLDHFLAHIPDTYKGGGDRIRAELHDLLCQPESLLKKQSLDFLMEKGLHRLIDTRLPCAMDRPLSLEKLMVRLGLLRDYLAAFWSDQLTWEIYIIFLLLGMPECSVQLAIQRLGLTRQEIEAVEKSFQLLNENVVCPLSSSHDAADLYEIFHALPMSTACIGLILAPEFDICLQAFVKYKQDLQHVKLEVSGDDILNLGIPQGEAVGRLLKSLFHAKLHGQVHHRLDEILWLKSQLSDVAQEQVD
jgi:tRNA nucleotidyltransferase (CCA-adding enzyme)